MHAFAVSGKGGTGKTVFSALLVRELIKKGTVLAVDADADSNLPEVLGAEVYGTVGNIREELLEKKYELPPQSGKDVWLEGKTYEILSENKGFDLLVMSRRTTISVQDMIVIADGSQQSFNTAVRIRELAEKLKARFNHMYIVLNRMKDPDPQRAEKTGLTYLGSIPYDPDIETACHEGVPLPENSRAAESVQHLLEKIIR
ncbi:MAG: hypothetical protein HXS40_12425 [Theionarchaea archaeon]|nr:hypothetical protein [Theionarchaea archaeon]